MSFSSTIFANDNINIIDSETSIIFESIKSKTPYKNLTKKQYFQVLVDENSTAIIPHNRNVGFLTIRIFSPIKTKIYLKWDNEESLYLRSSKEIKFKRAGDYKSISFNAVKPISGHIYLMTKNNDLIRKINYKILKQRKYTQSVRFNLRESDTNFSEGNFQSSSISYSIGERSTYGRGRWSGNVNFSENSNSRKSISAGVGYSW